MKRFYDAYLKGPARTHVKVCPDLTGLEIHKALTFGGSDTRIPVMPIWHGCIRSECAGYDPETDTCKKYGQKVTYTEGGEAID